MEQCILVITNVPDASVAKSISHQLIEKRLAACINQLPGIRSVYRWNGVIEEADEVCLLIKTRQSHYAELEMTIKTLHPYEIPEIIVLPIINGLPSYFQWIENETKKDVNV
jgi:periplasmic divalent cation tolerance protein